MAFESNIYVNFMAPEYMTKNVPDLVEQGMTKSVRATLEQFARTGQTIDPNRSNFSYADEFDDREPLDSERIDNLLDRPDFTGESEMEMMDFLRENTTEVHVDDLKKQMSRKKESVAEKSDVSEEPKKPDTQPAQ